MKNKGTDISTAINHLSDNENRWFAIYTKYKCEKYIVDQLGKKGIAAYVPLIEKTKRYVSKIKRYEVPLINCYVFVYIVRSEYVRVLETEYVMGFLKQRKSLISIPEREMDIMKLVVGEIENVEAGQIELQKGDEVEIISGNLTGIRGVLSDKEGKNKFIVQLTTVGFQLAMTIDKRKVQLVRRSVAAG